MRERVGPRLRESRLLTPSGRGVGEFTQPRAHFSRASLECIWANLGKECSWLKLLNPSTSWPVASTQVYERGPSLVLDNFGHSHPDGKQCHFGKSCEIFAPSTDAFKEAGGARLVTFGTIFPPDLTPSLVQLFSLCTTGSSILLQVWWAMAIMKPKVVRATKCWENPDIPPIEDSGYNRCWINDIGGGVDAAQWVT